MASERPGDRVSQVEFATYFVALQAGGAERILYRHHPMPNGLCAGCLATPTVYPCQAARIAELARQRAEYCAPTPIVDIAPYVPDSPKTPPAVWPTGKRTRRRR
jgi:hypothetical protein